MCAPLGHREIRLSSERTAFGGHGAVLSVLLGEEGDGSRYFGEQPGISWPQDGVGGVRPDSSPALCPLLFPGLPGSCAARFSCAVSCFRSSPALYLQFHV